ncbi:MAG TPA: alpha/beta hydrolase [Candidatus Obscuribacterales bacterium]
MGSTTPRWVRRWVLGRWSVARLGRSLLIIYAVVTLYVFFTADSKIFLPPASSYAQLPDLVTVPVGNHQLAVLHLPNPNADYTLLYSHGNAEDLGLIAPVLDVLYSAGVSVVSYDYSGYGLSTGKSSEQQSYRDITAVYRYMVDDLEIPSDRILIHGRSVGGGPSLYLATQESSAGMILESTFTSAFRVLLPIPIFPFDKFPNRDRLRQLNLPVLIIHGEADDTISIDHGRSLYAVASDPKQSLWVPNADHNDLVWVAGDDYVEAVRSLVSSLSS